MMDIALIFVGWLLAIVACADALAGIVLGAILMGRKLWGFDSMPGGLPLIVLAVLPTVATVMSAHVLNGGATVWLVWAIVTFMASIILQLVLVWPVLEAEFRHKFEMERWNKEHVRGIPAAHLR